MIKLTQIPPQNLFKQYEFKTSFPIHRNKQLKEGIYNDDEEISRSHAEIHLLPNYGFFLQDMGSGNHTYLKVLDDTSIALQVNMEILMGNSLFQVEKIKKKTIKFIVIVNFTDEEIEKEVLEIKFNNSFDDIFFGKAPKENGKSNFAFTNDAKIENLQAIFKKYKENFLLTASKSTYG